MNIWGFERKLNNWNEYVNFIAYLKIKIQFRKGLDEVTKESNYINRSEAFKFPKG